MKRLHLFEFEDLAWFPRLIRDFGTDFLRFITTQTDLYRGIVPLLASAMEQSGHTQVIDLASGGGGGWLKIASRLKSSVPGLKVRLSDYYPNLKAFQKLVAQDADTFAYETEPVSALAVPPRLQGFRTQFLSFHHFRPEQARQILQDAVKHQQPIAIFEAQDRTLPNLIKNFLSPISVLLVTPFIRPFKWTRLLFTYLIPVVPLFVWWDGVVSVLRTYRVSEMEHMISQLQGQKSYTWQVGKNKAGPTPVLYLIGYPK